MIVNALKFRGAEGASNKGVPEMCDYSLQTVKSGPAKVGDRLTTRDFGTCTHGFASLWHVSAEFLHDRSARVRSNAHGSYFKVAPLPRDRFTLQGGKQFGVMSVDILAEIRNAVIDPGRQIRDVNG
jgi:hypothetical protein